MSKIKLLEIYPIDPCLEKVGGIETFIRDFIENIPENFELEIVGIIKKDSNLKLREWQNINVKGKNISFFPVIYVNNPNVRTLIPLIFKFTFALFLCKNKIEFKSRIIIFHRLEPAIILNKVKEKKVLFIHGDIRNFKNKYCESRWSKIANLYYFLERFFINSMSKIFVVSKKGCEYYKIKYPNHASRIKFFPTWYNANIFYRADNINRKEILSRYKILDSKPIILYVGRLELAKDPILLIDSFFIINKRYPGSQLVIIGDGSLKPKIIKKVTLLSLKENVFFLGNLTHGEVAKIMNISDLLLLTSRFEGMPRVVLESLACGLPVVATNVGENYLMIKDGVSGKLVSSWDPEKIAESAIEVISNNYSHNKCIETVSIYTGRKVILDFFKQIELLANESI